MTDKRLNKQSFSKLQGKHQTKTAPAANHPFLLSRYGAGRKKLWHPLFRNSTSKSRNNKMGKYSYILLSPALGPNGELILDLTNALLLQPWVPALQLGINILQFHINNQKHITEQMYVTDTYQKYKERTTCSPRPRAIHTYTPFKFKSQQGTLSVQSTKGGAGARNRG